MVKVGPDHNDKHNGMELQGTTGVEGWFTRGQLCVIRCLAHHHP